LIFWIWLQTNAAKPIEDKKTTEIQPSVVRADNSNNLHRP